mmetsp:Transcript_48840/g.49594  ORF Transcript_48840/g.49594 Transcript_48840/m.49594 type:complete len:326 (+) Transcript_48840:69-1046(+)
MELHSALPARKRRSTLSSGDQSKAVKMTMMMTVTNEDKHLQKLSVINSNKQSTLKTTNKAREIRLQQNRKAARESRRRKKTMIEDLQRSVIFFSQANGTLKHQNDELTRLLIQAQAEDSVIESNKNNQQQEQVDQGQNQGQEQKPEQNKQEIILVPKSESTPQCTKSATNATNLRSEAAATSDSAGTVSSAISLPSNVTTSYKNFPVMQPGATMQAMANFQQASAAAMQAAVQGMQQIPGVSLNSFAQPAQTNGSAQQAYFNDTMTALAMQQAAVAAASTGQTFYPGVAPPPQFITHIRQHAPRAQSSAPSTPAPISTNTTAGKK